ncbi:Alkaline-phosphatase-like, core domain [Pseudocohnilembus persalinus]|uniref:Alkaline-phosphatase-like, core domain n=1 Tax=Pseudocohnilembus persalinus TaxID=266149 RepID=A0A0V0R6Z8_PSEPJ|nr:Alkaline-phosphatase-like, core domain [Pseudocohnilembus persalinus]|eukprot:KRX10254.1 Alkaline-phosphatase-like, core domain [Pseudocohnilembus persalinus]
MEGKKAPKILFVLMDGIGDVQTQELDNQTPLEKSKIPFMDAIAKSGITGIMDPVETGLSCGSDTAHMNIFGYNPFTLYKGRGAYETMGAGLDMNPGDIAFKCNFAHMDKDCIVKKRRVDRGFEKWGLPLIQSIDGMKIEGFEPYYISAKHATEHRCGIKVTGGKNLTNNITGTDPLKDNLKLRQVKAKDEKDEKAVFTAKLVNQLSNQLHEHLEKQEINLKRKEENKLTANLVLLRGCGERLDVPTFEEVHKLKGVMIAPTAIIRGLGMTIGMDTPVVEGATGYYDSNFSNKLNCALDYLENKEFDFGFIHIKATDDAGHDKSAKLKVESFEKVDKMLQELAQKDGLKNDYIICITGDHTTPYHKGDHTFEPVPVAITTITNWKKQLNLELNENQQKLIEFQKEIQDQVQQFNEKSTGQGVLGRFPGQELLGVLKKLRKKLAN